MVESTHESTEFDNAVKTFTDIVKSGFDGLKSKLPEEQMKKAELRVPEMIALKSEL